MSDDDQAETQLDEHADRLWLARAVASPDAWRLRATNSAGLLSAAAAATVAGLIFRDRPLSDGARLFGVIAAVCYIVAVVAYLIAGVWPSPRRDETTEALAEGIWKYCRDEAKPIKWMIAGATISAVFAIASTGATLVAIAGDQAGESVRARISVTAPDTQAALSALCPTMRMTFDGAVEERDAGRLRIELPAGECGSTPGAVELSRDSVILRYPG